MNQEMDEAETKKCGRCKAYRPVGEFYHNASRKDGLDPYCQVCKLAYKLSHADQGRASQRKAYYANLEEKRLDAKRRMQLRRTLIAAEKEADSNFAEEWKRLCASNAYRCFCCGRERPLRINHVVPVAQGGQDDITNLQPLCATCSRRKGSTQSDYKQNPNVGN